MDKNYSLQYLFSEDDSPFFCKKCKEEIKCFDFFYYRETENDYVCENCVKK